MIDPETATAAANLSEPLTWTQICERYPNEWVALVEIDRVDKDPDPPNADFHTARVAAHGKTRKEPYAQSRPLWARYQEIAHYFTGPIRAPLVRFFAP